VVMGFSNLPISELGCMRVSLERDELLVYLLNNKRWGPGVEMRQHPLQLIRGPLAAANPFEQPLVPGF
jgi:hypothetical protein